MARGTFTIEQTGELEGPVNVGMSGIRGLVIMHPGITGHRKHDISFCGFPAGICFVMSVPGSGIETRKVLKTRYSFKPV
jgi:hypothetical protein